MVVTREELEAGIARLQREISNPEAGIYGPDSVSWRVDKESIIFVGGGRAALLQLAHPFVAHAVDQHSETRRDPLGRFQRTFDNVFAMVFGDLDRAVRSARRVHAIHSRITGTITEDVGRFAAGTSYLANDEESLMWVHATLLDSALLMYETVLGPLPMADKHQFYEESKRFALLFGISERVVPPDYPAFRAYMQQMLESDVIRVGTPAREIGQFLFAAPRPVYAPVFKWLETMSVGLLTPRLREEFGFRWGKGRELGFRASVRALKRSYPKLPPRLRYLPAYVRARRRLAGKQGPDRVGDLLERIALSTLRRKPA